MTNRIARILERVPADLWAVADNGELVPTLDLYLYIANELGIEYSVRTGILGDLYHAIATLHHEDKTITADALSRYPEDDEISPSHDAAEGQEARTNPDPTRLSQLQSRALLKAFRLYLYPHIRATQPGARKILLATLHILYRERGYNRSERLAHASHLLGKTITSFTDLTNAELAELIVALNLNDASSQYD